MRKVWKRAPKKQEKKFRVNQQIRVPEVFVIDETGTGIGNMPTQKAIDMAREVGCDLVEVNPTGQPPVVKIMDFGQFKYEKEKQAHKQKALQKKVDTKGIRLSVRISQHDFDFRIAQALKFLEKGNKLKVELVLKGRERQHPGKAVETINGFIDKIMENKEMEIIKEQDLTRQGGRFTIILANKKA